MELNDYIAWRPIFENLEKAVLQFKEILKEAQDLKKTDVEEGDFLIICFNKQIVAMGFGVAQGCDIVPNGRHPISMHDVSFEKFRAPIVKWSGPTYGNSEIDSGYIPFVPRDYQDCLEHCQKVEVRK